MNPTKILIVAALSLAFAALSLRAQIVVDVGNNNFLQPNTAGQTIEIFVNGGALVGGLNLNVQIADGFPDVPGSTILGPKLTGVDTIGIASSPTIFFGNNTGEQNPNAPNDFGQIRFRTVTTQNGTVSASGRLAILTFDTAGISPGVYALRLNNVFGGPTTFVDTLGANLSALISDGTLTVVPEPVSTAVVATSLLAGALLVRRYRRS